MRFATLAVAFTAPFLVGAMPTKVKPVGPLDVLVLQFAEVLERLESDFYTKALAKFKEQDFINAGITIPAIAVQNFQAILEHETSHTQFLGAALDAVGAYPVPNCTFNFDSVLTDVKTMASVARVVEAVGVGAYLGGSVLIVDKNILVAAASILTIEARHQSFLNVFNGANAIPQAFDIALKPEQVLALAGGFIEPGGCDLGIIPNPALAISNTGAIAPGTKLTFQSSVLENPLQPGLSCQMITGNNVSALSFPIEECVVPSGINGPVVIFITNDPAPLDADVVKQKSSIIIAGPTIAFIDAQADALGALVRSGPSPVQITDQITPSQANEILSSAGVTETSAAATDSASTDAPAATESLAADESAATPSDTGSPDATAAEANSAPTSAPEGPIKVIGYSTIPV